MNTSKSVLSVAREALAAAEGAFRAYSCRKSPRKFTQPQLAACLVVKEFLRLDYRGVQTLLAEWSDLREVLGLRCVPHFTTLWAAQRRLLAKAPADLWMRAVLDRCRRQGLLAPTSRLAAMDSTGLETRYASRYYTRRCERHRGHSKSRYPKLSAVCDTATHLVLGAVVDRGPKVDHVEFQATLRDALSRQPFATLVGDAGYDSEKAHRLCRQHLGIRSIFALNPSGRRRLDGRPRRITSPYRRRLARRFPQKTYGQRWQMEAVFSMLKRHLGSALAARRLHSQRREILLRLLTHNLMILWRQLLRHVLYRAGASRRGALLFLRFVLLHFFWLDNSAHPITIECPSLRFCQGFRA